MSKCRDNRRRKARNRKRLAKWFRRRTRRRLGCWNHPLLEETVQRVAEEICRVEDERVLRELDSLCEHSFDGNSLT